MMSYYMIVRMRNVVSCLLVLTTLTTGLDFGYHNQAALENFFNNMRNTYPELTWTYSVGKSVEGADLWVMSIGESPIDHVLLRPNVKYIGNIHGNEVVGREMLLHLIEHLLTEYRGGNSTIINFLSTTTVHIMPSMNPDGFAVSELGDCVSAQGRNNKNGFDLNRNFPDQFVNNPTPLQEETKHIMKWGKDIQFVLSAHLHGGSQVVGYPFDSYKGGHTSGAPTYSKSPDDGVFRHLAKVYSHSHSSMYTGVPNCPEYPNETFPHGIINGAEWYPLTGGMQDYNYIHAGCMEVTIEMTCCKYPKPETLSQSWEDNRDALINYLMEVHRGVKGTVVDCHGDPIPGASVVVEDMGEIVFRTTGHGEYWRILLPGQYTLTFSARGHCEVSEEVTVVEGGVTLLNVVLPDAVSDESKAAEL